MGSGGLLRRNRFLAAGFSTTMPTFAGAWIQDMETNQLKYQIQDLQGRSRALRGYL